MVWRVSVVGAPVYRAKEPGCSVHKHHPIVRDLIHLRVATQGNRSVIHVVEIHNTTKVHSQQTPTARFSAFISFQASTSRSLTPPSRLDEGGHHRRHRAGETPSLRRELALSLCEKAPTGHDNLIRRCGPANSL